jgi:hypothetical protein
MEKRVIYYLGIRICLILLVKIFNHWHLVTNCYSTTPLGRYGSPTGSFLMNTSKLQAFWRDTGLNNSQGLKCNEILRILDNPGPDTEAESPVMQCSSCAPYSFLPVQGIPA